MTADLLPSVSVVIATHHRPELLRKALDAVAAQTYAGRVECVVVFDQAPVDGAIAAPSVRVVPNARSAGLAGARNTGIDVAEGELIAFCDDDDEWFPAKLASQVERMESSGADVVVSGIEVHYGDRVVPRVPAEADLVVTELARRRVMEAHPSTVLVRRTALLERIGLVDEEIPGAYGEDFDWILRAAQAGPIAVVSEPLVKVRWGAQSYFQQRWRTIIESIDYGLRKHAVLSADPRGHARLVGRKAFAHAALGESRPALRFAWKAFRLNWKELRSYIACVVALRLLTADRALRLAHSRGRGI
ncbi:glycosyltransferase family 2 protein [Flindersiella endophytica]